MYFYFLNLFSQLLLNIFIIMMKKQENGFPIKSRSPSKFPKVMMIVENLLLTTSSGPMDFLLAGKMMKMNMIGLALQPLLKVTLSALVGRKNLIFLLV